MAKKSGKATMNAYTVSQLRQYLDIINTSGRFDEVVEALELLDFKIYIDTDKVRSLLEEADRSLNAIKDADPQAYERIRKQIAAALEKKGNKPDSFIGSPDCPC